MELSRKRWATRQRIERSLNVIACVDQENQIVPNLRLNSFQPRSMNLGELATPLDEFLVQFGLSSRGAFDVLDVHLNQRRAFLAQNLD
jgi:hypothetical protein